MLYLTADEPGTLFRESIVRVVLVVAIPIIVFLLLSLRLSDSPLPNS